MAAWALSRIDSPSRPVSVRAPLPGMPVASMKRISPPVGVQASPVATPGVPVRSATSRKKRGGPSTSGTIAAVDRHPLALALGVLACDLAADRRDLALEVPQARLAGVVGDDLADRVVGERHVLGRQAVRIELLGDDVLLRDQRLLLLAVAGELEHLHPVEQGGRDRLEHVGRGDEHHPREVEIDVQVMVAERRVLLGVEHLQQRRGGVAPEVGAELVDLVEHEDRVVGLPPCGCPG